MEEKCQFAGMPFAALLSLCRVRLLLLLTAFLSIACFFLLFFSSSFRNDDLNLPVGLRLHSPQTDYVLATVLGHAKSREEDEPSAEAGAAGAAATPQQPSAIQLEKDKKAKERREEEEMVAQKLAQKARK